VSPVAKQLDTKRASVLSRGQPTQLDIPFSEFFKRLKQATSYDTFIYGISDINKTIVSSRIKNDAFMTRTKKVGTKGYFYYPKEPGVLMLDIDHSKYSTFQYTYQQVFELFDDLIPTFSTCAKIVKQSSSSFISEKLKGFHIYVPILDLSDSNRFIQALHNHLWLCGHGYIAISRCGSNIYDRSTIDTCTASPERIDFVAPPITEQPTYNHINNKPLGFIKGGYLDTSKLEMLDKKDVRKVFGGEMNKRRIKSKQAEIQKAYDVQRVVELTKQGHNAKQAISIVGQERINEYKLLEPSHILYFDDGTNAPFKDYLLHLNKTLMDPINEDEYGKAQLTLYYGEPVIKSFAHGGRLYHLNTHHDHTIHTLASLPGTRKTTAALKIIKRRFDLGNKQIISVITLPLMDQYVTNLKKLGLGDADITVIHAEQDSHTFKNGIMNSPSANVSEQLSLSIGSKKLILITHEALINYGQAIYGYDLIIDEVFCPFKITIHQLEDSISDQGILKEYLEFIEQPNGSILLKPRYGLRKKIKEYLLKVDSLKSVDITTNKYILEACTNRAFNCYLSPMNKESSNTHAFTLMWNTQYLRAFNSVLILSAFIKHTALYHLLSRYYNLKDISKKVKGLVTLDHRFKKLKLIPFVDYYTKYERNQNQIYYNKQYLSFPQAVNTIISVCSYFDEDTLRIPNLDVVYTFKKENGEYQNSILMSGETLLGKHLGTILHGLNNWQSSTSAVIDAAFNLDGYKIRAIRHLLPNYDQWLENTVLSLIQIFMRTCLRDYDSLKNVHVMLPDRRACEHVCELLNLSESNIIDHCLIKEFKVLGRN
jgi:hypothetical protein